MKIAVAGIPRSGTTMTFRALAGLPRGGTTPKDYDGPIVKTHTRAPQELAGITKAIFLFGDPVASVISTRHNRSSAGHFTTCGVEDISPDEADLYVDDLLGSEKMFDAWTQRQPFDCICVRYESLHDNLQILNTFFGQHLYVQPYRARATRPEERESEDTLARIKQTYATFIRKVEAAPDVMIYRAS